MRRKVVFAIAAAVLGFIALNIIFASLKTEDARSSAISCILNLQRVGAALSQYVSKHNSDAFPDSLEVLVTEGLITRDDLKCPASRVDYKYMGGIPLDAPAFLILVWCENEHNIGKDRPAFAMLPLLADLSDVRPYEHSYFSEMLKVSKSFSGIASLTGEDGVSRLLGIVRSEDNLGMKALAIWKLGTLARQELSETFARYLTPLCPDLEFESARALGRIGDRRGAKVLVEALQSNSYLRRRQAFLSLQVLTKGETFSYNPLLPDKAQSETLKKWQTWLETQRK